MEFIKLSSDDGEQMKEFFTAYSKAQACINNVLADTAAHKHKYAELHQVLAAIRKPFADNGLAIIQTPVSTKSSDGIGADYLTTMITHSSGQWLQSSMILPADPSNKGMSQIQALGSHITYARRYMAAALSGIAQVDDESELVPSVELEIEHEGVNVEELKAAGIAAAKVSKEAANAWYAGQSASVKKYLSTKGKSIMNEIKKISSGEDFAI